MAFFNKVDLSKRVLFYEYYLLNLSDQGSGRTTFPGNNLPFWWGVQWQGQQWKGEQIKLFSFVAINSCKIPFDQLGIS